MVSLLHHSKHASRGSAEILGRIHFRNHKREILILPRNKRAKIVVIDILTGGELIDVYEDAVIMILNRARVELSERCIFISVHFVAYHAVGDAPRTHRLPSEKDRRETAGEQWSSTALCFGIHSHRAVKRRLDIRAETLIFGRKILINDFRSGRNKVLDNYMKASRWNADDHPSMQYLSLRRA